MFCRMNYILYELIIYRAFVVRRREMARNPIDEFVAERETTFLNIKRIQDDG